MEAEAVPPARARGACTWPAPAAAGPAAAEAKATGAAAEAPTAEAANATETAAQQPAEAAAAPPPPPADASPREAAPSPAICSETNRQAAEEWLDKARKRHEAGDDAAALRFCEKSLRLHEGNEATAQLAAHLRKFGAGTPMAEAAARVLKLGPRENAAVLQLSATQAASADAVRAAYRKLALLLHPDKNQARQAEAAFKRLQVAYEALSAQASGTGGGGGPSTRPSGGSSGGSSRGEYSDEECFCTRCGEYCEYGEELCARSARRRRNAIALLRRRIGADEARPRTHTARTRPGATTAAARTRRQRRTAAPSPCVGTVATGTSLTTIMDGMVGIGMAFIEFILATQASRITQIVKPTSDEPLKRSASRSVDGRVYTASVATA